MRSDILRLGRSTFIYGIGQVVVRLVSLLLLPVFTAYLTPLDYGISSILALLIFLVTPIFALGVTGAIGVVYFERSEQRRQAATIWTAVAMLTVSAGLLVAIGALNAGHLSRILFAEAQPGYDLEYLVVLALVTAGMSIVSLPMLLSLQLAERAKSFVAITVASAGVSILLSLVLIVVFGRGVAGFIEAGAIAQGLTLVLATWVAIARIPVLVDVELAFALLRLGIPLLPTFIAAIVIQQANKYLLQAIDGLGAVGLYTVGFNLGLFSALVVSAFTNAWFPFFSSFMERQGAAPPVFARIMTYYVVGIGSLSLMFFIWARPVALVMLQPRFHDAFASVGPSAAAQFLLGAHSILSATMYFAKDVRYAIVIQGAAALLSIGLNLALIPILGTRGAAIALVLGVLSMVIIQHGWNRYRRYLHVPYERGRLLPFAALYVAIAAPFLLGRDWPLALELASSLVSTVVVIIAVVALTTPSERSTARELLLARFRGRTAEAR
jgi:O-antigen/teichoic acid export membrane protein